MLSFLCSQSISVVRVLETESNEFDDSNYLFYDAVALTRYYTQHAVCSETNHENHFITFFIHGILF